jgi:type VI secretion system protein ImpC
VYEEEYGVFGGTPFGALVGDYYFDKSGQDIELLEKVSNVAAAAHAPVPHRRVAHALQPRQLLAARLAARPGEGVRHHRVREVEGVPPDRRRALRGARRAAHAPREPYGAATVPVDAFNYEERVDGTDHDAYLWGNAATRSPRT